MFSKEEVKIYKSVIIKAREPWGELPLIVLKKTADINECLDRNNVKSFNKQINFINKKLGEYSNLFTMLVNNKKKLEFPVFVNDTNTYSNYNQLKNHIRKQGKKQGKKIRRLKPRCLFVSMSPIAFSDDKKSALIFVEEFIPYSKFGIGYLYIFVKTEKWEIVKTVILWME